MNNPFRIVIYESEDAPASARWMAGLYLDGTRLPIAFYAADHDKVLAQAEKHAGKEFEKHAKTWMKNAEKAAAAAAAAGKKAAGDSDPPTYEEPEEEEPI